MSQPVDSTETRIEPVFESGTLAHTVPIKSGPGRGACGSETGAPVPDQHPESARPSPQPVGRTFISRSPAPSGHALAMRVVLVPRPGVYPRASICRRLIAFGLWRGPDRRLGRSTPSGRTCGGGSSSSPNPTQRVTFVRSGNHLVEGLFVRLPSWGWRLLRIEPLSEPTVASPSRVSPEHL